VVGEESRGEGGVFKHFILISDLQEKREVHKQGGGKKRGIPYFIAVEARREKGGEKMLT